MRLERVAAAHGGGEAEELGGRLVPVEHVHATCEGERQRQAAMITKLHRTNKNNSNEILESGRRRSCF